MGFRLPTREGTPDDEMAVDFDGAFGRGLFSGMPARRLVRPGALRLLRQLSGGDAPGDLSELYQQSVRLSVGRIVAWIGAVRYSATTST